MPFNLVTGLRTGLRAMFADEQPAAPVPTPEMGEVAYADVLYRLYGDPKKAFPVYNLNEVAGKKGIRYFTKMWRDDQVKAALALKRYAIVSGGWTVNSPGGRPKDWEPTAFVEECLNELGCTFEGAADGILSKFAYGFSLTEKIWSEQNGMIHLADLKTRHPYGIQFQQDAYGNVLKIIQGFGISGPGVLELPAQKFLLAVHDGYFSNPYGQSDLESAYRPWWIKENAYKWMAILLEKMGIPPIFINYDSNTIKGSILAELKTIVTNMQAATNVLLPRGAAKDTIDFWAPELAGNVASVFAPAIKMLNEDIARALLMPALLGLTPDTNVGSQARSTVHFDVFLMVIERERKYLEVMLNRRIVRDIVDYNFAGLDNERPYLQLLPLNDQKKLDLFKLWGELTGQSVVTKQVDDEKHLREVLRMPEMSDETLKRREDDLKNPPAPTGGTVPRVPGAPANDPDGKLDPDTYALRSSPEDQARRLMDSVERQIKEGVQSALAEARDKMLGDVRRQEKLTPIYSRNLQLRKMSAVQDAIVEGLRVAWSAGNAAVKYEVSGVDERGYRMNSSAALVWIKQMGRDISGIIRDDLQNKAKVIISAAIGNGEPITDTIVKLAEIFLPYLGDDRAITDDEQAQPYRLETIVRTNTTAVYNRGRLDRMLDPEVLPYLAAVRYSAILDTRTTEVCQLLHGRLFKPGDAALERAAPPLHFNCRSLLVPVTLGAAKAQGGLKQNEFVTPELLGRVEGLANGKGGYSFYQLYKPVGDPGGALAHLRRYADELGVEMDIPEGVEL